jgi:predicted RNA-binding protein with PIN domain
MLWLIDGYNVIRRDPDLAGRERTSLEEGRRGLLRLLARVARGSPERFQVVFDGARSSAPLPPDRQVQVIFSRPPERADDVLIRIARARGSGAVVVSSDRVIQQAARRAGAIAVTAEAFLDRLQAPAPGPPEDDDPHDAGRLDTRDRLPARRSRQARGIERALGRLRPEAG